jgi:hypothetical protein
MNLNNEDFFVASSGYIISPLHCSGIFDFGQFAPYKPKKLYNTCEYCHSDVEIQAVRCSSCGAPKNSYKIKERNYYE